MFSVTWGLKIPSYRSRNCGLNTGHAGSARTPTYLYTVDETSKHHSVDVMRLSVRLLFPKQSLHTLHTTLTQRLRGKSTEDNDGGIFAVWFVGGHRRDDVQVCDNFQLFEMWVIFTTCANEK